MLIVMSLNGDKPGVPPSIRQAVPGTQTENGELSIDWDELPSNFVAWVYVPGTKVDYPVVRDNPEEPGFYLSHDAEGAYSEWGTPYVANGCEDGLESPLVMIYGHHMSDGTMFADFARYGARSFAEDHDEIILHTRQRAIHLEPKLVNIVDANAKDVRLDFANQEELDDYMAEEASESEVSLGTPLTDQRAYAFVTCSYETGNSRTIVYATEKTTGLCGQQHRVSFWVKRFRLTPRPVEYGWQEQTERSIGYSPS